MIADLDDTIRELLIAEMPIRNSEIDINFDQPKREWSARLTKPTVNFFLHDVRENVQLRNYQWQRVDKNGRANKALLKRPPFRIDCHYMMTCWASEPEDEHKLLTRSMLTLFRFGKLPEEYFQGRMVDQEYDVTTKLAAHDKLTNPAEIWSALDNELRPSVPFSITITLDPWTPIETPILGSFGLRTARLIDEEKGILEEEGPLTIAGTVRYAPPDETPFEGATVTFLGTGLSDRSDRWGRYHVRGLPPGNYDVELKYDEDQPPHFTSITIPSATGYYDFDLPDSVKTAV